MTWWCSSALYVVDLAKFRQTASGDTLRVFYEQLSKDPNSLSNLDQVNDLLMHLLMYLTPNRSMVPITGQCCSIVQLLAANGFYCDEKTVMGFPINQVSFLKNAFSLQPRQNLHVSNCDSHVIAILTNMEIPPPPHQYCIC